MPRPAIVRARPSRSLAAGLLLLAAGACSDSPSAPRGGSPRGPDPLTARVVGYFPTWSGSPDQLQYSGLTHVMYAFLLPTASGGLTAIPASGDARLADLVRRAHGSGVKVLVSVGGWNDGDDSAFRDLAAGADTRAAFTQNLVTFVDAYGLDGVDIDWEFPDPGAESANFTTLMQALSDALHARGKLLTAAVLAWGATAAGVRSDVFPTMDFLSIMAYDLGTPHSSYSAAVTALDYWSSGRGLAREKLVLGVPFYGRNAAGAARTYRQLVQADPAASGKDESAGFYYNGTATIRRKTDLALDRGSGVMIWELSQDADGGSSLLTAIVHEMQGIPD